MITNNMFESDKLALGTPPQETHASVIYKSVMVLSK